MQNLPSSLRIGILRGGPSPEYDVSLKTGANVIRHLSETHRPLDIFISKDGLWHVNGLERSPDRILKQVDIVFNTLSPAQTSIQELLHSHAVLHIGSDKFASLVSLHTPLAKKEAQKAGIKTPVYMLVRRGDSVPQKTKEIFNSIPHPLTVKPAQVSSTAAHKVSSFAELLASVENILGDYETALVEEYIVGKSATCLVTENFRGENLYAFPPQQLLPIEDKRKIETMAKRMHEILKLSYYSQSDFLVSPRRGIYFLQVNTAPEINENSSLCESLAAVGISVKDFLHHLIGLALNK